MEKMLGSCGLNCKQCNAYIATKNDDMELRKSTAEEWSKLYKVELKAEHINCDGCTSGSERLLGHCSECEIRKCAQDKNVKHCGQCDDFGCERISGFLTMAPEAKVNLEEFRQSK